MNDWKALVGALGAWATLLGFLSFQPWPSKDRVEALENRVTYIQDEINRRLTNIENDLKELTRK